MDVPIVQISMANFGRFLARSGRMVIRSLRAPRAPVARMARMKARGMGMWQRTVKM